VERLSSSIASPARLMTWMVSWMIGTFVNAGSRRIPATRASNLSMAKIVIWDFCSAESVAIQLCTVSTDRPSAIQTGSGVEVAHDW
jgi:hypothetical protein